MTVTKEAVEAFLFHEAEIADAHLYSEWLALWAEDAFYWVPCNDDDSDPEMHVSIIQENYTRLEDRIRRLNSGFAHVQSPNSRISRIIGNVRIAGAEADLVEVRSVFNITEFRRQKFHHYAGRQIHHLRAEGDSFKIARKTVYLVNNDGFMHNMTFLL
jgi:3-phenylpropionate/cinnamic acid dioxygenase small subunit